MNCLRCCSNVVGAIAQTSQEVGVCSAEKTVAIGLPQQSLATAMVPAVGSDSFPRREPGKRGSLETVRVAEGRMKRPCCFPGLEQLRRSVFQNAD